MTNLISLERFNSLDSIRKYFCTRERCLQFIEQEVSKDHEICCPYCGGIHPYRRGDGRFKCKECGSSFSILKNTIFEASNLPLQKWFEGMYLISAHKKGISSCQLARDLSVTQKTAWYILHKVRTLFAQDDSIIMEGEVEMDETYVGGNESNKHEWKKAKVEEGKGKQHRGANLKTPVFGMWNALVRW